MASSRANSSTASGSIGSAPTMPTDIRAPLWDHVTILEPAKTGGGNTKWKCNYCPMGKVTSYTRVEAHLLQFKGKGIAVCPNVSFEMLSYMRAEVKRCQDLVEKARERSVSLPTEPAPSHSQNSSKKNKRPESQLEKAWAIQDRKHLDALIARGFYSGGMCQAFGNVHL
uniref:BED-type domain-containing protein n=1 Tax=Arundo donax TaxID=35708 RepID=A0A0A9FL63_ARUDO